jgi:hypothetical protein
VNSPETSVTTMQSTAEGVGESSPRRDRGAHCTLLALAGWCAWRPVETFPTTAVVVAASILGLSVWAWRRTPQRASPWLIAGTVGVALVVAGMLGWDPASAILEIALAAAMVALVWMASRSSPPEGFPTLLALVISALALWGLWQATGGLERMAASVGDLPEELRAAAFERLASGRAFASQTLPSHLAVLFATALPLLLVRLRLRWSAAPWVLGSVLCVVGLALTRSPVGAALALAACGALALRRRHRLLIWIALVLILILAFVAIGRGDVMELKPVKLRVDNWRTALWVWSETPAAGVGVGGFAQAAQAVPFEVGNRPRHAHSLPLEMLAELGPVGLLVCALATLALWRLARDVWRERPELSLALAVIPAHNLIDFSLYSSGVALAWAVLLGWGVSLRNRPRELPLHSAKGRVVLVSAVALAVAATVLHLTSIAVEESAALQTGPRERFQGAIRARRLAPWRVDPLGLVGNAALETGEPRLITEAFGELEDGRWLRPRSAAIASLRARLAMAVGEAPTAVAEAWTAAAEQPSNQIRVEEFEALRDRLEPRADDDAS